MAVTWAVGTPNEGVASNGKRTKTVLLTPTGTYTTGGDALVPSALGLKGITRLFQAQSALARPGLSYELLGTTEAPLIRADVAATGGGGATAEVANGTTITGKAFVAYIEGF